MISRKENLWIASQKTRFGIVFVAHQVVVWWVVTVSAPILLASGLNCVRLIGWSDANATYNWVLRGNPYFPAYAALGLLLTRKRRATSQIMANSTNRVTTLPSGPAVPPVSHFGPWNIGFRKCPVP